MSSSFVQLLEELQDAIDHPTEGAVNEKQCQVEAEIIGYLLGRKVVHKDAHYVPKAFDTNSKLLARLNEVATRAFQDLQ